MDEETRKLFAPIVIAFLKEELYEAELDYKHSQEEDPCSVAKLSDIDGEISAYTLSIEAIEKRYEL